MQMTKPELISQLENAKNNYILELAAISLFGSIEAYPILENNNAVFGPYTVEFDQVANLLRNTNDRDIAIKEFLTSQIRSLIKESFELIQDYSKVTGQALLFKAEPWYPFARMIRNCLSHNFRFEFREYDRSLLPVSWKARTIISTMEGQPLALGFFGYVETWELFQEYQNFAQDRLV